jgi:ATP-dependent Clp protease adaptor protein ClpS
MSGPQYFSGWFGPSEGRKTTTEKNAPWQAFNSKPKPSMYSVLILDDSNTPKSFLVTVLEKFFHISMDEAAELLGKENRLGQGNFGRFTKDVAETKATQIMDFAKRHNHHLRCIIHRD